MSDEKLNPNINDNGHTIYPKMVYPNPVEKHIPGKPREAGIIVNNAKEEAEVMGEKKKPADWGK